MPGPKSEETSESSADSSKTLSDLQEETEGSSELEVSSGDEKLTCVQGHLLEIHPEDVIKALREFVEKYHAAKKAEMVWGDGKSIQGGTILSRSISPKDMTEYWKRYREVFSRDKEKLWDALMIGLHKYHDILKERHKLRQETDCLKQQNDELRRLLETYQVKVCLV